MNTPHALNTPLPFGKLAFPQPDYNEFVCSRSTMSWLQAGAMTRVDGRDVRVVVKEDPPELPNVIGGFYFKDAT